VTRREENLSCKHCKKEGNDDDHCWKLHPEKRLKFAISSKFVDEVTCDVVPLNECEMVLGSPYLYDHKAIF
jgi:hypothetical protein